MHRRQFMEKTGTAILTVTGLPLLIKRDQTAPAVYVGSLPDGTNGKWAYEMKLHIDSINRFTAAKEEQKKVGLKLNYIKTGAGLNPAESTEFEYSMSNVILLESTPKKAEMHIKWVKKNTGNHTLSKELPKDLVCIVRPYLDVVIQDNKAKPFVTLKYVSANTSTADDEDYDCFLTTACVQHKGLPDNCYELEKLRWLRENHMRGTASGETLLQQYEILGPSILNSIRDAENRTEILEHVFENLVLPSVGKIEEGNYEEAVQYYQQFVKEMEEKYLNI